MNRKEIIEAIKNLEIEKLRENKDSLEGEFNSLKEEYLKHQKVLRVFMAIKATDEEKLSTVSRIEAIRAEIQDKVELIELLNLALTEFEK